MVGHWNPYHAVPTCSSCEGLISMPHRFAASMTPASRDSQLHCPVGIEDTNESRDIYTKYSYFTQLLPQPKCWEHTFSVSLGSYIYTNCVDICSFTACEEISISKSNPSILFRFMNHQITIEIFTKLDAQPSFSKNCTCIPWSYHGFIMNLDQIWEGSSVTPHHPVDSLTRNHWILMISMFFEWAQNEPKKKLKKYVIFT